jgi:hypothetical protein
MTLPPETISEETDAGTPRKRRARSQLPFMGSEERDAALDLLAHRAFPSVGFFLGTISAAIVLAVAVWIQSIPLVVAALLLAPPLGPMAGAALGLSTASFGFSFRNATALLLSIGLACIGVVGVRLIAGTVIGDSPLRVAFDIPTFLLVVVSSVILTVCIVRSPEAVRTASAGLWFIFLSGLTVSLWNLVDGRWEPFGQALLLTAGLFFLSLFLSAMTFMALGFRPPVPTVLSFRGFGVLVIVLGGLFALWVGMGAAPSVAAIASPTPTVLPSPTPLPTATSLPSQTPSPTNTELPSLTPTTSPTPTPTPAPAVIRGTGGKGVFLRDKPNGKQLRSLVDGEAVEVLGLPVVVDGISWLQVRTSDGTIGWIAMGFCATNTPTPK